MKNFKNLFVINFSEAEIQVIAEENQVTGEIYTPLCGQGGRLKRNTLTKHMYMFVTCSMYSYLQQIWTFCARLQFFTKFLT